MSLVSVSAWILCLVFFLALSEPAVAALGDPICAKNALTLRTGPGTQYGVSWKVPRYMPFIKVEIKNSWVKVRDLDGEMHWAPARDLTTNIRCVVVKSTVATIRKEPSQTADTLDLKTLDRFTPLKRLEANEEWLHVEDETGRQAWIHESTIWKPVRIQSVTF